MRAARPALSEPLLRPLPLSADLDQAREQLAREPFALPRLEFKRRPASIFDYHYDDIAITGYQAHPHIKAPVAI